MPRITPIDPGGGPSAPPPATQTQAALQAHASAEAARATVRVHERDRPDVLGEGPLKFEGSGLTSSWDANEHRSVITVAQVLFGAAADRPATPATPCVYIATDSGVHSSWDGTTWRTI